MAQALQGLVEKFQYHVLHQDNWNPPGTNWTAAFEKYPNRHFPHSQDLLSALYFTLMFSVIRIFFDRFVSGPIGMRAMNIRKEDMSVKTAQLASSPSLEKAFAKAIRPSSAVLEKLAAEHKISKDAVSAWFKQRRNVKRSQIKVKKFTESAWRFTYYILAIVVGVATLINKSWLYDASLCFSDEFPYQDISTDVRYYYLFSLGFYGHLIVFQFFEEAKKDFWEMFVHHVSTILLIALSWVLNYVRIGTLVLLVHDISDPWLEFAKMMHYAKLDKLCDAGFVFFAISFAVSRLWVYPFYVIHSTWFDGLKAAKNVRIPAWWLFNILLIVLLILHIYWFYLIMRMVYRFVIVGGVEKDERSATDVSELEELKQRRAGGAAGSDAPEAKKKK